MAIESVEETTEVSDNNELVAQLLGKPRNTDSFTLYLGGGLDDAYQINVTMQAMGTKAYDKLIAKYPPTTEEKAQGLNYELDKFAPALLAESLVSPKINLAQAKILWNGGEDENWSRGDVESLFSRAIRLNHRDSTVPFTERG